MNQESTRLEQAEKKLATYVAAAAGTGAIPVPAASLAIIAENAVMIADIASGLGIQIDPGIVTYSYGLAGVLNYFGRQVFIEGAKLLSWGTGNLWFAFGLSALGATTAGIQTYTIGRLVIAICQNGGRALDDKQASKVVKDAQASYETFVAQSKDKDFPPEAGGPVKKVRLPNPSGAGTVQTKTEK